MKRINTLRINAVIRALLASGARSVLDLGCGAGALLSQMLIERQFHRIIGVDQLSGALLSARERLLDGKIAVAKVDLIRTSFTSLDERLRGFDAAAMVETIEHVEPHELSAVERAVFGYYRPGLIVITTPNRDYNHLYGLPEGRLRHRDHKFEWGRRKFESWASGVASRNGYFVGFSGIGAPDCFFGSATQMAKFELR